MDLNLFVQGLLVGVALAVPVGPIALVCIQRALVAGRGHGIAAGLGVATADAFYAGLTVFWITLLSAFFLEWQWLFKLVGGLVLICVGIWLFRSVPPEISEYQTAFSYTKDYLSTLVLTLANLLTIVLFIAILPGLGIVFAGGSYLPAVIFVFGVFLGETVWWVLFSWLLGTLHLRHTHERLTPINMGAGLLITCFGIALPISILIK